MADDLSLRAKRLLTAQYNKLLHDENAVANASSTLIEIVNWCDELECKPGKWVRADKTYRFSREYIEQINQALLDEGYASIYDDFSQDSHQNAAKRNPNEKQGQRKPTHHLVLAAITQGPIFDAVNQGFYLNQQVNIELDISKLTLDTFDCLVVVENRDSFNDWFAYQSYSRLSKPLVIYRGDKYHSRPCKTLLRRWLTTESNKPAIYFGDFDLAGLRIALSAGYSHLLLPEYGCLAERAIKQHYPDNQLKYKARFERDCPKSWQPLFALMSTNRAGLRQQKMYQTPLVLWPSNVSDETF